MRIRTQNFQWFSFKKWIVLVKALDFKGKLFVFSVGLLALGAFLFWLGALYVSATNIVPAVGGTYTEGVVGQPAYVNPLLSQTSESDADIVTMVYGSLFSYDTHGALKPDLAERYEVSEDGLKYTVFLNQGVKWHDGQDLTAQDVEFTLKIVQDPAYKSPLRPNWQGVDVAATDNSTLVFTLKKSYFGFLDNLTVGILPKHIWENIAPEKFSLAEYNLEPIGSGPYQFHALKKDSNGNILTYELRSFPDYFKKVPYISKVIVYFYESEEGLIEAYNRKEILGMSNLVADHEGSVQNRKSTQVYTLHQPRLFGVFFNGIKNVALAHKEVRQALAYSVNREELVQQVLRGRGSVLSESFLSQMQGFSETENKDVFDKEKAKKILEEAGWTQKDGIWEKGGAQIAFTLTVPDWPELVQTSDMLRKQWMDFGVKVDVQVLSVSDLQQNVLRPREYDALLFGEAMSLNPDPYSFWHSSQKHDPGLNLAIFDNKDADDILASARETLDQDQRIQKYAELQNILTNEMPAAFLYSPFYLYVVSNQVQGIGVENINMPSDRLRSIADWYMETDRVLK